MQEYESLDKARKQHCKTFTKEYFYQMVLKHLYGRLNEPGLDRIIEKGFKGSQKKFKQILAVKWALQELKGKSLTSKFIKQHIDQHYGKEVKMSPYTITRILKYDLQYSYRKPSISYCDPFKADHVRYREWFKAIFGHLVKKGLRFLWIDEVAFNPTAVKPYSWQSKQFWEPLRMFQSLKPSNVITAMTDEGTVFAQMRYGTNNALTFAMFMEQLELAL